MRFVIEIISEPENDCLTKAAVDGSCLSHVQAKASQLIEIWADHGARSARIVAADGSTTVERLKRRRQISAAWLTLGAKRQPHFDLFPPLLELLEISS
jgi:hypothetical protein